MHSLLNFVHKFVSVRGSARSTKSARRTVLQLEHLEDRLTPSAGGREQYMLELVNRMRMDPASELTRILASNDANVVNAMNYFNVDRNVLAQQWATLTPQAPLAWNDSIALAALAHSQNMLQADQQSHQLPGEVGIGQRMINAGWDVSNASWAAAENIYAFAESVFHAHAALAIDWGFGASGLQSPPGHRINIMDSRFREMGIGLADAPADKQTGPLLVTQDFGYRSTLGNAFLLGVVYKDIDKDGFYSVGEGLSGVNLTVAGPGGTFNIASTAAGGYQLQVPAGVYTVTASGGGLAQALISTVTVGTANVRLAFVAPDAPAVPAAPSAPTMTGPFSATTATPPVFTWTATQGAVRYELWVDNLTTGQREVIHQNNVTTTSFQAATKFSAGNYRAWVKAYDSFNQGSAWSASLTFAVGAPATPKMLGPISGTTAVAPKFTWSASSGAVRYDLWVDNLTTGQEQVVRQANLTTNSYLPVNGLAPGTYRAWVKAYDKLGLANGWSAPLTFTVTGVAPAVPKLAVIAKVTTVTLPKFSWSASFGAAGYDLWINNVTTGQEQVIRQANLSTTSYTAANVLAAGTYRVWVRAFNSQNQFSAWSGYRNFTVAGAAPAAPLVTSPVGVVSATPTFTWTSSLGAVRYQVWVDSRTTGQRQVISQSNITSTSFTATTPLASGSYRVWVRAYDSTGRFSAWSPFKDFSVAAVDRGQKVADFAAGKLGQQVGGGECAHLVEAALNAAGARTTADYGVTGANADYVWGDLIATYSAGDNAAILNSLRAGDIIQYRNVEIREGYSWWTFPHHTAIVKGNLGGGKLTILEQNVNGERWVHETTQNLAAMTSGVVKIYRPVQK